MNNKKIFRIISTVIMVYGALALLIKLIGGVFTDMLMQLKVSLSLASILFVVYMLLKLVITGLCLYTGFLGFKGSDSKKTVGRCVRFGKITLLLIVIAAAVFEIALPGSFRGDLTDTLIGAAVFGALIYFGNRVLSGKKS